MEGNKPKSEFGSLTKKAEALINEKANSDDQHSYSFAIQFIYELEVHQIEIQLQNEELILANKNAKESFEQFIKLYDFAPIGYLTLSEEGSILELNYKTASLFGKEHQIKGFYTDIDISWL